MPVDTKHLESGYAVITISGRLALGGESERLEAAVKALLHKDQKKVILDITGLDYVDSSGVGMLVSCLTNVKKAGGDMKVVGANQRIKRIFSMTGIDGLLQMFATVNDAAG
jgi:anti-anti-sigma factor